MEYDNKNMFLFWGSGSMPSWRAMIVLAEKGLLKDIPGKLLTFMKMEHKGSDVMKLNPRGQMPSFKDGDVIINESGAICMYLEYNYSNEKNRLIPADRASQGKMFQRMYECENMMSKVISPIAYERMYFIKKENWNTDHFEKAKTELKLWNGFLEGDGYLAGSSFSMADAMFFPYLAILVRLGVKFEENTNLLRYYDLVCKRPSVQESWPPHWRENPSPNTMEDFVA